MKPSYKIALIFVTVITLGGILFGLYKYNLGSEDLQKVKPDFIVSAEDLVKAFEADENAATARYTGKIIEVSGIIQRINPGENNALGIALRTGSELSSVICTIPGAHDLSEFKTGEQITIRGECSGFLLDVLLNNCVVVR
jgi:hypothetical protein